MSKITSIAHVRPDRLPAILVDLHRLLDSNLPDREWTCMMWYVLAHLEQPLRKLMDPDTDPAGSDEVDHVRNTLARRHQKLTQVHRNLLEQCLALKWELYRAAEPCGDEPLGKMPPLQKTDGCLSPDVPALRAQIRRFIADLESCQAEQTALVLESVTTDLGAGD